jgi:hypothetical protein
VRVARTKQQGRFRVKDMDNHYSKLQPKAFWRAAITEASHLDMRDIYERKWRIWHNWNIATAGSCFAQHIASNLKTNGYRVMDVEPAPWGLPPEQRPKHGFGLYSARYGNIYTARQLRQLAEEVFTETWQDPLIWEQDGRYYDAIRPNIEPGGFATPELVQKARQYHLEQLRQLFLDCDLFIFTLGLTEAWRHKDSGRVVPIAPGVMAGGDVIDNYEFVNFDFNDVLSDMKAFMNLLAQERKKPNAVRYLLTVSPVPLTATASGNHVLTATTYSKSVLRAVAGTLSDRMNKVDYFPSYEIVTNPAARGTFFSPNMRSVRKEGVEVVMNTFFHHHPPARADATDPLDAEDENREDDGVCEEQLLEAF